MDKKVSRSRSGAKGAETREEPAERRPGDRGASRESRPLGEVGLRVSRGERQGFQPGSVCHSCRAGVVLEAGGSVGGAGRALTRAAGRRACWSPGRGDAGGAGSCRGLRSRALPPEGPRRLRSEDSWGAVISQGRYIVSRGCVPSVRGQRAGFILVRYKYVTIFESH